MTDFVYMWLLWVDIVNCWRRGGALSWISCVHVALIINYECIISSNVSFVLKLFKLFEKGYIVLCRR